LYFALKCYAFLERFDKNVIIKKLTIKISLILDYWILFNKS